MPAPATAFLRPTQRLRGLFAASYLQRQFQLGFSVGIFGALPDGLLEAINRLVGFSQIHQHGAEVVERTGIVRLQRNRRLIVLRRTVVFTPAGQNAPQRVVSFGNSWIKTQCRCQMRQCFVGPSLVDEQKRSSRR